MNKCVSTWARRQKRPCPTEFQFARESSLRMRSLGVARILRGIANRMVHRFFGRGLVMPLDQVHSENPASHPELLDWLARDLAEHNYDLKRVARGLVLTNAYARSSRWESDKLPDDRLFAVVSVRALAPMQMATSLKIATADPKSLATDVEKKIENLEKSASGLANLFPQPTDNFQVGVAEAMLFANNEALQKSLLEGANTLVERMKAEPDLPKLPTSPFARALSRPRAARRDASDYRLFTAARIGPARRASRSCGLLTKCGFRFNH